MIINLPSKLFLNNLLGKLVPVIVATLFQTYDKNNFSKFSAINNNFSKYVTKLTNLHSNKY